MQTTPALDALAGSAMPYRVVRTDVPTGAEESARLQGIPLHALLRTIVVRRGEDDHLFLLIPGGRRLAWPKLRAHLGVSRLSLFDAVAARAVTGYERGAITPFGAARACPVVADATVLEPEVVAIGGGAWGVNLHVAPADLVRELRATVADISEPA